jgi:alpha-D-ribose 1-methylphosphonate 5-triphosphate synthase subunit PhnH
MPIVLTDIYGSQFEPKTKFECYIAIGEATQSFRESSNVTSRPGSFLRMLESEHTPPTILQYAACAFSVVCVNRLG